MRPSILEGRLGISRIQKFASRCNGWPPGKSFKHIWPVKAANVCQCLFHLHADLCWPFLFADKVWVRKKCRVLGDDTADLWAQMEVGDVSFGWEMINRISKSKFIQLYIIYYTSFTHIYSATWFARTLSCEGIGRPGCHPGRASSQVCPTPSWELCQLWREHITAMCLALAKSTKHVEGCFLCETGGHELQQFDFLYETRYKYFHSTSKMYTMSMYYSRLSADQAWFLPSAEMSVEVSLCMPKGKTSSRDEKASLRRWHCEVVLMGGCI